MKRHTALQPLSHQHHNALVACMLIRKGIQKNADKKVMKEFVMNLWNEELLPHFEAEEKLLFPLLSTTTLPYKNILSREHATIKLLKDRVSAIPNGYTSFKVFSDFLEQHVRFEERVVFNHIQEHSNGKQLEEVERSLHHLSGRKCTDYPVKFWE